MEGEAKVTEEEEFEFRLRYEREKGSTASEKPKPSLSYWDKIKAAIPEAKRAAIPEFATYGNLAAGAVRGAGSIGSTILRAPEIAEQEIAGLMGAKDYVAGNPNRRQEMTKGLQSMGADPNSMAFKGAQLGTEMAGVAGIPVASAQKMSYIPRIAANALSGGAAAGLVNPSDAGFGAMFGAGLTAIGAPIGYAGTQIYNRIVDPALNLTRKEGATNLVRNYLRDLVGEKNVPATIAAASQARPLLPGYPQNVIETMVQTRRNPVTKKVEQVFLPEASPLSAITRIEASQSGGASAKFGKRIEEQELAIAAAEAARNVVAKPMRDTAMRAANMAGGVDAAPISAKIQSMMAQPENYGAPVVKDVLSGIKADLDNIIAMGQGGRVDASAIYAMRKDLGKTIQSIANSKNITFDKGITSRLADDIQSTIDDEINKAIRASGLKNVAPGVTVYDRYMNNFAKASDDIRLTTEGRELAANPPQRTTITGGRDIAKELTPQVGQMLSRPVMMSNWTLRILGKAKEPEVDEAIARILTNPSEYVGVMSTIKPNAAAQVTKLLEMIRNPAIVAGAAAQ